MRRRPSIWFSLLLLVFFSLSATGAEPWRLLLINSFGREFAPYDAFAGSFRAELVRQSPQSVDVYEVSLVSARFSSDSQERPTVAYVRAIFGGHRPDLIVPLGGPAVGFAQKYRQQLFPATPMLLAAVDERHLRPASFTTHDTAVAVRHDLVGVMDNILRVLPHTTNVSVVVGNSPLGQFWLGEMRRALQPFTNRVGLVWFNELSFAEMLKRCATLPPRSAIFYAILAVDAEGAPHVEVRALEELRAAATAPIFGLYDTQLGRGIVGGPLMGIEQLSRNTARVATRILSGEMPGAIETPVQETGTPSFDWRELRRWSISESQLPPGSLVRFREPAAWQLYKWRIVAITTVGVVEALLLVALLRNLNNRRRAERSLEESRNRLRAILDTSVEGIITVSERGVIETANAATEQIFGYPAPEMMGQNVSLLMPTPLREEHDRDLPNHRQTHQPKIIGVGREGSGRRKDDSVIPLDLAVSEITFSERRIFKGFVRDITERKQAEQTAREFGGRRLHAQEAERARLARELHDDITQRLARLAIDAGRVATGKDEPGGAKRCGKFATAWQA